MKIYKKITILLLTFMVIPMFFVGYLSFYNSRKSIEKEIFSKLESIVELKAAKINAFMSERKSDALSSQWSRAVINNLPVIDRYFKDQENPEYKESLKKIDGYLRNFQEVYGYADIMLLNPKGIILFTSSKSHSVGESGKTLPAEQRIAFEAGSEGIHFSDVYGDKFSEYPFLMMLTAPIKNDDGEFIGVIAFEINMGSIYELIQDRTGLGDTGESLIGKKTAYGALFLNPLRHDSDAAFKKKALLTDKRALPIIKASNGEVGSGLFEDYRGVKVIAAWDYIPSLNWGMVAKIDLEEAFEPVEKLKRMISLIGIISVIVGTVIIMSVAKSITEPIHILHEGTEKIGDGDLDFKVGTDTKDEIGQLSRAFDDMSQKLKSSAESLKSSEEKFRQITNTIPGVVYQIIVGENGDRRFAYLSEKIKGIYGINPDEWFNNFDKFHAAIHPDDRDKYLEITAKAFERKTAIDAEFRLVLPGGEIRWVHSISAPLEGAGEQTVWNGVAIDITERKRAESELKVHGELTANIAEGISLIKTGDGKIAYINPSFEKMFGYEKGELIGKNISTLNAPTDKNPEEVAEEIIEVLKKEGVWRGEIQNVKKDGSVFWCSANVSSFIHPDFGEVWVSVHNDITARKKVEEERLRLVTAIEQTEETVLITDINGNIQYVNPGFKKSSGYEIEEAIGKNPRLLKSGVQGKEFYKKMWGAISSGKVWVGRLVNRKKDGTFYEESETISPIFNSSGKITNYVAVKRDITYESLLEHAKNYFTSVTSHELRTPLIQLQLAKAMLEKSIGALGEGEGLKKAVSVIDDSFQKLNRISEATSLLSELSIEVKDKKFETIYLYVDIMTSLETANAFAKKENRDLSIELDVEEFSLETEVKGNQEMILRVLEEMLSNAIKYTPDGKKIFIKAATQPRFATIEIRDEGIGIPKERMSAVFEPYFSLENVMHHSTGQYALQGGGIGLGLTISRMIMQYHGGQLTINSEGENMGSVVTLSIPIPDKKPS